MKNKNTYIIVCRKGLCKTDCPIISNGLSCVECNYSGYILRNKENNENKENDGN